MWGPFFCVGTLPHALTLTLSHSLTHSLTHYYYCTYCFYYGDYCQRARPVHDCMLMFHDVDPGATIRTVCTQVPATQMLCQSTRTATHTRSSSPMPFAYYGVRILSGQPIHIHLSQYS